MDEWKNHQKAIIVNMCCMHVCGMVGRFKYSMLTPETRVNHAVFSTLAGRKWQHYRNSSQFHTHDGTYFGQKYQKVNYGSP